MRTAGIITAFLIGIYLHLFLLGKVEESRGRMTHLERVGYVMPSDVLRLTSVGFKGLVADSLFLKASTFFGGKKVEEINKDEWTWIYETLDASTQVNPYLLAPYYFGESVLPWEAGMVDEANLLLERGSRARVWDWMLPYFLGFNQFFFLKEDDKAVQNLMEAAKRPKAWFFIPRLATKLSLEGGRTETAITFLQEILKRTEDITVRRIYERRLEALQRISFLEKAISVHKQRFGLSPKHLQELVAKGVIRGIPEDPYGGVFYIDENERVKTTSNLRHIRR